MAVSTIKKDDISLRTNNSNPSLQTLDENGHGVILNLYNSQRHVGYLVLRPMNYIYNGRKIALQLYDNNWNSVWEVFRDVQS